MCVCDYVRERVHVCVRERESERACVCEHACVGEGGRQCMRVCVFIYECTLYRARVDLKCTTVNLHTTSLTINQT